jgi:hypothetical protein
MKGGNGILATQVEVGKSYKMIQKDGSYVNLGKCVKNEIVYPSIMNNRNGEIHIMFKKNPRNLIKDFYGSDIFSQRINVVENNDADDNDADDNGAMPVTYTITDAINDACKNGNVPRLEQLKKDFGVDFRYGPAAINMASLYGHVNVLEWFKNSGLEFKYDESAVNNAARNGHIEVLDWFKNSGFEFKYNPMVIETLQDRPAVLEWFKNLDPNFKNSHIT